MNTTFIHISKWLALTFALLFCQSISAGLNHILFAEHLSELLQSTKIPWANIVLVAAVEATLIYLIIAQLNLGYKKQVLVLFLCYWGCKYGQSLVEGLFYLNLWLQQPLMTITDLTFHFANGLVTCVLICPLAVIIVGSHNRCAKTSTQSLHPINSLNFYKKLILLGFIYVPVYFIAGIFLAMPLGGDGFNETYATLQVPLWMPLMQWARGIVWALLLWILLTSLKHTRCAHSTLIITVPVFLGIQLLLPTPYISDTMRYAHFIEVIVSMAIYAQIAVWVFYPKKNKSKRSHK